MTSLPTRDTVVTTRHVGSLTIRTTLNPAYRSLQSQMESIADIWERGDGKEIFKGRNSVCELTIDNVHLAVKRYGRLSLVKSIIYTYIRPSKAIRAFVYSLEYMRRGIPTPEGVAAIEIYRHNLLADSYFVSLFSPGKMLFQQLVPVDTWDERQAARVADFIFEMHRRGIINRDPNLKNILATPTADGDESLEAIDINRSVFSDKLPLPRAMIVQNLARITHRRPLLKQIVGRYASLAGEPSQQLTDQVMDRLDKIENNRNLRHAIRDFFKKK